LGEGSAELRGELMPGARELDLEFGGFPRAEKEISNDFGRSRGN
jgi:hypothetical protein